jgi:hypothetical protein
MKPRIEGLSLAFVVAAAFVVAIFTSVIGPGKTQAVVNGYISFQGKLTNPDGTNVTDNNYSILFTIYSGSGCTPTGGSPCSAVWSETQTSVAVADGIFYVNLGSANAFSGLVDFNASPLYLSVKVGSDPEMSPRIMLTSSPYAFNSSNLNGLSSSGFVQLAQGLQTDASTTNTSISINKTGATAGIIDLQRNGGSVFNINNNGETIFKPQADSTTVWRVQNAGATLTMLQVDTSNNIIYVGGSSADTTAVLFVFDEKSSAGDPTGVNGGVYYNSSWHLYRCFRGVNATVADGRWEPCGTPAIERVYEVNDEFLGGLGTTGNIGDLSWTSSTIGTAVTYSYNNATPAVSATRPGILRMRTANTINTGSSMQLSGSAGTASTALGVPQVVKTAVAVGSIANPSQVLRIGLHNETTATTAPSTGVWWEFDRAQSANWRYCYNNAGAVCAASTVAAAVDTFATLEIRINSLGSGASSADFFVNGIKYSVSGVTINTNNRVSPAMVCYAATAANYNCFIDYFQFRGGDGSLR